MSPVSDDQIQHQRLCIPVRIRKYKIEPKKLKTDVFVSASAGTKVGFEGQVPHFLQVADADTKKISHPQMQIQKSISSANADTDTKLVALLLK